MTIEPTDLAVTRGLGDPPAGAVADPRHPALGWRAYGPAGAAPGAAGINWTALRVAAGVPESGVELIPNDSYILETGFERLNGVDFRKGCYVGQEVTARMKHKTDLRKGLAKVALSSPVPANTLLRTGEKTIGKIHTVSGNQAIAYLRFDKATSEMSADGVRVTLLESS